MNRPHHDETDDVVVWNHKPVSRENSARSVVVLHPDDTAGRMIAARLQLEGFEAVQHASIKTVESTLQDAPPGVLLIDTRAAADADRHGFHAASVNPAFAFTLRIAIAGPAVKGATTIARELGFDGLCTGCCLVWKLAEMLRRRIRNGR